MTDEKTQSEQRPRPEDGLIDLVPDYVRGRLSQEQAERLRTAAESDPVLAAEIAAFQAIAGTVRAEAEATPAPGTFGWARLSRAIEADGTDQSRVAQAGHQDLWRVAAVLLGVVAVGQFAFATFGGRTDPADSAVYVPVSEAAPEMPTLQITFAPDATEQAIRALLLDVKAEIYEGPSALGLYRLRFDSVEAQTAALTRMRQQTGIVESVSAP